MLPLDGDTIKQTDSKVNELCSLTVRIVCLKSWHVISRSKSNQITTLAKSMARTKSQGFSMRTKGD